MSTDLNFTPANCPVCNSPMKGKILVCEKCWWEVSPLDRSIFRGLYLRGPKNAKTKGESIVRKLKEGKQP